MTTPKMLLFAGLLLAAGMAEAQKNTGGEGGQAPATTGQEQAPAAAGEVEAPAAAAEAPAAVADGALISASDPQSVVSAIQALGFAATLGVDTVGDPMITSEIDGIAYTIYFYGCTENANCQYLHFQAGFDLPNGWTLEAANQWNAGTIVTDAALDAEMDPILEHFVTTAGGLNQANFADAVDWWRVMLAEFKTAIGF